MASHAHAASDAPSRTDQVEPMEPHGGIPYRNDSNTGSGSGELADQEGKDSAELLLGFVNQLKGLLPKDEKSGP